MGPFAPTWGVIETTEMPLRSTVIGTMSSRSMPSALAWSSAMYLGSSSSENPSVVIHLFSALYTSLSMNFCWFFCSDA